MNSAAQRVKVRKVFDIVRVWACSFFSNSILSDFGSRRKTSSFLQQGKLWISVRDCDPGGLVYEKRDLSNSLGRRKGVHVPVFLVYCSCTVQNSLIFVMNQVETLLPTHC
jgi:hypothetical protein